MKTVFVTRKERFSAAHRLYRADYTDEENFTVFGKCSNPNWHGHNYTLYVTIKGSVSDETGFVADLKAVSQLIHENVITKVDHRNINLDVDFMAGKLASTENLAIGIWEVLEPGVKKLGAELHGIRLEETENNFVEYFGK
jgi:6-pyruvoyltetrahydropterin/6-carboxytetrahydropterin synthase